MTWSILARDEYGHLGIAIASRFFAVGALCVHSRRGVGALSTQALMNPLYGPTGIDALERGYSAADTLATLLAADEGRDQRQVHALPVHGPGAAHTGSACIDWCGHLVLDGLSVAGNMLAGPHVIEASAEAYLANVGPMRDAAINLRALPEQRDLIDQAASLLGKNRSDFMPIPNFHAREACAP
jgi:uncharacterized Ntn-hydrolase superfamily protein